MTIIGAIGLIAALAFGIYWGLPTRYEQPFEEIDERLMEEGDHQKVKRRTTFLSLLQRKAERGSERRRSRGRTRTPFRY